MIRRVKVIVSSHQMLVSCQDTGTEGSAISQSEAGVGTQVTNERVEGCGMQAPDAGNGDFN